MKFEAEHLASLESSNEIQTPEQAIIKLHQLNSTKLLHPIKVNIRLEHDFFVLTSRDDFEIIEKLPYQELYIHNELFVRSVTDKHKNIALITVKDALDLVPPEFILFQFSSSTPVASLFLEKFKEFKKNQVGPPREPLKTSTDSFKFDENKASQFAKATLKYRPPTSHKGLSECFQDETQNNDLKHSLQQYLELLNHCLDDIEAFVAKLQLAAASYEELQAWKNNKQNMHGGGIRLMRAQPPPAQEFFDVFQKFKLAFNILPILRGHIKKPNVPELVHHLFKPLDLIVESSCSAMHNDEDYIWKNVVIPLLNTDTLVLFADCLNTNEADLLNSLGTPWNIASDQRAFWLNYLPNIPAYKPVFIDGYKPSDDIINTLCPPYYPQKLQPTPVVSNDTRQPSQVVFRPTTLPYGEKIASNPESPSPPISEIAQIANRSPKTPHSPKLLAQSSPRSSVTNKVLETDEFLNQILSKGLMAYVAIEDKQGNNDHEFDVKKGDIFELLEAKRLHSKVKAKSGQIGYVSSDILKPYSSLSMPELQRIGVNRRQNLSTIDYLNKEFQEKLTHAAPDTAKKRTVTAVINEGSTPEEVNAWLVAKGFDETVQRQLSTFGGKQLFVMDKGVLERLFGPEVGSRLNSQVLVQRNKSGYKTLRANELDAILKNRKKKSDSVFLSTMFNNNNNNNDENKNNDENNNQIQSNF